MLFPAKPQIKDYVARDIYMHRGDITPTKARDILSKRSHLSLLVVIPGNKDVKLFRQERTLPEKDKKAENLTITRIENFNTVGEDEPINTLFPLLNTCPFLLTVNEKNEPCGYLTGGQLAKALTQQLQELQLTFNSVLEASEEIITISNAKDKVLYWNKKAETFYGIKKKDIIGNDLKSFFQQLVLTDVLATGKSVQEAYHQPKPGLYVLINSLPIKVGDRLLGGVSLERDITEMVNLNRELHKATTRLNLLQQEMAQINNGSGGPFDSIYGHSPRLKESVDIAKKVAPTHASVLIRGESGTGKELFARAIHQSSQRKNKPFIALNCGAIPANLFESELFGYEPGAFTGAEKGGKQGRFELADEGTLFLDEIGEMDFAMQVKLLRVLQDHIFFRVGGSKPIKVDVRILAATNKDLEEMMSQGKFRRDLYYRLNVVSLETPPLRDRKGDIPELVYLFINEFARAHKKEVNEVSPHLMTIFLKYNWPGNVRELRNVIERLVVLTEDVSINADFLPRSILDNLQEENQARIDVVLNGDSAFLGDITSEVERKTILKTLRETQGNKTKAAQALGIPRSTFYYRLNKLGLDKNR